MVWSQYGTSALCNAPASCSDNAETRRYNGEATKIDRSVDVHTGVLPALSRSCTSVEMGGMCGGKGRGSPISVC